MTSEVRGVEVQKIATPIDDDGRNPDSGYLHMVAVLTEGPDGWRCYEAAHNLAVSRWEEEKAAAVEWTRAHGNKVPRECVGRYFILPSDIKFAA